jgi:hypothetical protein
MTSPHQTPSNYATASQAGPTRRKSLREELDEVIVTEQLLRRSRRLQEKASSKSQPNLNKNNLPDKSANVVHRGSIENFEENISGAHLRCAGNNKESPRKSPIITGCKNPDNQVSSTHPRRTGNETINSGNFLLESSQCTSLSKENFRKSKGDPENIFRCAASKLPAGQLKDLPHRKSTEGVDNVFFTDAGQTQLSISKSIENIDNGHFNSAGQPQLLILKPVEGFGDALFTDAGQPQPLKSKSTEDLDNVRFTSARQPQLLVSKPVEKFGDVFVADADQPQNKISKSTENLDSVHFTDAGQPQHSTSKSTENIDSVHFTDAGQPQSKFAKSTNNINNVHFADAGQLQPIFFKLTENFDNIHFATAELPQSKNSKPADHSSRHSSIEGGCAAANDPASGLHGNQSQSNESSAFQFDQSQTYQGCNSESQLSKEHRFNTEQAYKDALFTTNQVRPKRPVSLSREFNCYIHNSGAAPSNALATSCTTTTIGGSNQSILPQSAEVLQPSADQNQIGGNEQYSKTRASTIYPSRSSGRVSDHCNVDDSDEEIHLDSSWVDVNQRKVTGQDNSAESDDQDQSFNPDSAEFIAEDQVFVDNNPAEKDSTGRASQTTENLLPQKTISSGVDPINSSQPSENAGHCRNICNQEDAGSDDSIVIIEPAKPRAGDEPQTAQAIERRDYQKSQTSRSLPADAELAYAVSRKRNTSVATQVFNQGHGQRSVSASPQRSSFRSRSASVSRSPATHKRTSKSGEPRVTFDVEHIGANPANNVQYNARDGKIRIFSNNKFNTYLIDPNVALLDFDHELSYGSLHGGSHGQTGDIADLTDFTGGNSEVRSCSTPINKGLHIITDSERELDEQIARVREHFSLDKDNAPERRPVDRRFLLQKDPTTRELRDAETLIDSEDLEDLVENFLAQHEQDERRSDETELQRRYRLTEQITGNYIAALRRKHQGSLDAEDERRAWQAEQEYEIRRQERDQEYQQEQHLKDIELEERRAELHALFEQDRWQRTQERIFGQTQQQQGDIVTHEGRSRRLLRALQNYSTRDRQSTVGASNSSDESENEEMAGRAPAEFSGCIADDAESWMRYVDVWLSTQRLGHGDAERNKINLVALYLKDAAQNWFYDLDLDAPATENGREVRKDYEWFKKELLRRFRRNEAEAWREIQGLWDYKQVPGQTTEKYVNEMKRLGNRAQASPDQLVQAATAGLLDNIKSAIMSQNKKIMDIDEIVRLGTTAERYGTSTNIANEVARIMDEKLQKFSVRPILGKTEASEGRSRPSSPRVSFDEDSTAANTSSRTDMGRNPRSDSPRYPPAYQNRYPEPYSPGGEQIHTTTYYGQNQQQGTENWNRQPNGVRRPAFGGRPTEGPGYGQRTGETGGPGLPGGMRPNYGQRSGGPNYWFGRRDSTPGYGPSQRGSMQGSRGNHNGEIPQGGRTTAEGGGCFRCGMRSHYNENCPATQSTCSNCGRLGHWRAVCRSARGGRRGQF